MDVGTSFRVEFRPSLAKHQFSCPSHAIRAMAFSSLPFPPPLPRAEPATSKVTWNTGGWGRPTHWPPLVPFVLRFVSSCTSSLAKPQFDSQIHQDSSLSAPAFLGRKLVQFQGSEVQILNIPAWKLRGAESPQYSLDMAYAGPVSACHWSSKAAGNRNCSSARLGSAHKELRTFCRMNAL